MKFKYLAIAIILEVIGSGFLKASDGFSKITFTIASLSAYILCFYFLALAIKTIPLGVAYAIWAGLGIVLTAVVSVLVFKQKIDLPAIIGMALIVAGVFIMNYYSKTLT